MKRITNKGEARHLAATLRHILSGKVDDATMGKVLEAVTSSEKPAKPKAGGDESDAEKGAWPRDLAKSRSVDPDATDSWPLDLNDRPVTAEPVTKGGGWRGTADIGLPSPMQVTVADEKLDFGLDRLPVKVAEKSKPARWPVDLAAAVANPDFDIGGRYDWPDDEPPEAA